MGSFNEKISDFIFNFIEFISIILVVLILGFIIISRLDSLFNTNLIAAENVMTVLGLEKHAEVSENTNSKPEIVFEGELPNDESKIEVVSPNEKEPKIEIVTFEITKADTLDQVIEKLINAGLIQDAFTFKDLLNQMNLSENVTPGLYKVPKNIKNLDLVETITISKAPTVEQASPAGQ